MGTPLDKRRGRDRNTTSIEFTPVGGSSEKSEPQMAQRRVAESPTKRRADYGNSWFDLTNNDTILSDASVNILPHDDLEDAQNRDKPSRFGYTNSYNILDGEKENFAHDSFTANGSHPLRQQQIMYDKLSRENINLKVKLATLNKYLRGQPQDMVNVIDENVKLRQNLVELSSKLKTGTTSDESKSNGLEEKLQEAVNLADDLELDIRNLKDENDSLASEIEKFKVYIEQLEQENENLNNSRFEDKARQLQITIDNLEAVIKEKDRTVDSLSSVIEDLEKQKNNQSKAQQLDSVRGSEHSLQEKDAKIRQLESSLEEVNRASLRRQQNVEQDAQRLQDDVYTLERQMQKLRDTIAEKNELLKRKSQKDGQSSAAENQTLKLEVELLRETIHEQKREISRLKEAVEKSEKRNREQASRRPPPEQPQQPTRDQEMLLERLETYQNELESMERELKLTKSKYSGLETQLERLQGELAKKDEKYKKLKSSVEQGRGDALENFEKANARWSEEKQQLDDEVRDLKSKLLFKANDQDTLYLQNEYRKLDSRYRELELQFTEKCHEEDLRVSNLKAEIEQLNRLIDARDREITEYDKKVTSLNETLKSRIVDSDESKLAVFKEKHELETKFKISLMENDNLRKENEAKISMLENRLSLLSKSDGAGDGLSQLLQRQIGTLQEEKTMLSLKVREQFEELEEQDWANEQLTRDYRDLEDMLESLQETEQNWRHRFERKEEDYKQVRDHCTKLAEKLAGMSFTGEQDGIVEELHRSLGKRDFELRDTRKLLQEKDESLTSLKLEYNGMKSALLEKCKKLQIQRKMLSNEAESLSAQIDELKSRKHKPVQYPPSPQTPTHNNSQASTKMEVHLSILEKQLKIYRLRLQDLKLKENDLIFTNRTLGKMLSNSERATREHIDSLRNLNIAIGLEVVQKPRPTLKGVAMGVLAAVRIRNLLIHRQDNQAKVTKMMRELNRERLELI